MRSVPSCSALFFLEHIRISHPKVIQISSVQIFALSEIIPKIIHRFAIKLHAKLCKSPLSYVPWYRQKNLSLHKVADIKMSSFKVFLKHPSSKHYYTCSLKSYHRAAFSVFRFNFPSGHWRSPERPANVRRTSRRSVAFRERSANLRWWPQRSRFPERSPNIPWTSGRFQGPSYWRSCDSQAEALTIRKHSVNWS